MNRTLNILVRYFAAWLVVCAVPLPVLYLGFRVRIIRDVAAVNTTIASTIAILLGIHISRQLFSFPGARERIQGISAIFAGFAIVACILLLLRIPYSVTLLAYSLSATAVIMIFWRDLFGRTTRNNFYVLPFGETYSLHDLSSVTITTMEAPDLPSSPDASIVADLRADLPSAWERMLAAAALRGIPVYHFKHLHESIAGKVNIEHPSENTLGSLVPDQGYKEVKWIVDRVGALIALPILIPFLLLVATIIKLQDGGSIIYRQQRMGLGGRPFTIYKFRSMSMRRDEVSSDLARESAITVKDDARITKFGAFIRRYRIDELPQIFNILKGEMSFIGPRPEAIPLAEWYDRELPFYSYRHIVKPGLTGWAQVNQGSRR